MVTVVNKVVTKTTNGEFYKLFVYEIDPGRAKTGIIMGESPEPQKIHRTRIFSQDGRYYVTRCGVSFDITSIYNGMFKK